MTADHCLPEFPDDLFEGPDAVASARTGAPSDADTHCVVSYFEDKTSGFHDGDLHSLRTKGIHAVISKELLERPFSLSFSVRKASGQGAADREDCMGDGNPDGLLSLFCRLESGCLTEDGRSMFGGCLR